MKRMKATLKNLEAGYYLACFFFYYACWLGLIHISNLIAGVYLAANQTRITKEELQHIKDALRFLNNEQAQKTLKKIEDYEKNK